MRNALILLVLGCSLGLPSPARAQSDRVRGLWEGMFHGGRGDQPMALMVRPRGATGFTGTWYQEGMEMAPLESGRVAGDSLICSLMNFDIVALRSGEQLSVDFTVRNGRTHHFEMTRTSRDTTRLPARPAPPEHPAPRLAREEPPDSVAAQGGRLDARPARDRDRRGDGPRGARRCRARARARTRDHLRGRHRAPAHRAQGRRPLRPGPSAGVVSSTASAAADSRPLKRASGPLPISGPLLTAPGPQRQSRGRGRFESTPRRETRRGVVLLAPLQPRLANCDQAGNQALPLVLEPREVDPARHHSPRIVTSIPVQPVLTRG